MSRSIVPKKNKAEDDIVMTPEWLAKTMIDTLPIHGKVLDPCRGLGAFYNQLPGDKDWCEYSEGKDFFEYKDKVDWIVTNPPWSIYRKWCQHSYKIADNIAYLITINHDLALSARIKDMEEAGFGIREVYTIKSPKENPGTKPWPQMGFQLGWVWKQRGYTGQIKWTNL
jgi:hypothetical protein